jgi:ABC-type multidrug transport system ATPase subunit
MTTASLIRAVRTDTTAIRTSGLSKRYGRTLALDGLDLSVERGEVYGYL